MCDFSTALTPFLITSLVDLFVLFPSFYRKLLLMKSLLSPPSTTSPLSPMLPDSLLSYICHTKSSSGDLGDGRLSCWQCGAGVFVSGSLLLHCTMATLSLCQCHRTFTMCFLRFHCVFIQTTGVYDVNDIWERESDEDGSFSSMP